MRKEFNYVYSSELDAPLRLRIISLFEYAQHAEVHSSGSMLLRLMVLCNERYVGHDVQTSFRGGGQSRRNSGAGRELQTWDEWLTLPIRYSELSRDAILYVSLWDISDAISPVCVAHCSKKLFSKHGIYRTGQLELRMKRLSNTSAPRNQLQQCKRDRKSGEIIEHAHFSQHPQFLLEKNLAVLMSEAAETERSLHTATATKKPRVAADLKLLLKKAKRYTQHLIDRVNWLDLITFSRIEEIKQEAKKEERSLQLIIEMASIYHTADDFAYTVIFYTEDDDSTVNHSINETSSTLDSNVLSYGLDSSEADFYLVDPELGQDNLCELKHHMLTRNARANNIDRRLQPNSATRDAIEQILNAPSSQEMLMEERDVIWKFRFWLKSNPKALVKFIRSVNWEEEAEVRHAIQVILEWESIDACDALELLTPSFTHPFVRRYAVSRLQHTTYANLLLFLPQLVQALRYETNATTNDMLIVANVNASMSSSDGLSMETSRAAVDDSIDDVVKESTNDLIASDEPLNSVSAAGEPINNLSASMVEYFGPESDLASFLIREACENSTIANFLYWYIKVEADANTGTATTVFAVMLERLKNALAKGNFAARQMISTLSQQTKFVDIIADMAKQISTLSYSRTKKQEVLKKMLADCSELADLKGLSLPLDPSIHVKNIHVESTILFSSSMTPMRLTFSTMRGAVAPYECDEAYTTIFKRGDDLRQDQLIVQMILLMDGMLKAEKLDLCLTPYAVLATSISEGFVQYVKAVPLANVKVQEVLRSLRPSSTGPYGIEAGAFNNYLRSCAGYSVISYILGIGDRHQHNLLLRENGKMFHVDFGFILGRDPKPLPPPMKFTSEMISAMGGQQSEHFKTFVDYITEAFCILRRNANLIINLFSLMLDSGIPDIAFEKEKVVQRVLERFHLHLSDESACQLINRVVETSISAKMPILVDFVHDVKQFISN